MSAGILGSVLPDFDYVFELATTFGLAKFPTFLFHWGVMHTVTVALVPFAISVTVVLFCLSRWYKEIGLFCMVLAASLLLHLGFDTLFAFTAESGLALFYPFSTTEFYYHAKDVDLFRTGF
jgi:hypothetical protein